jgi:hypothetical protein
MATKNTTPEKELVELDEKGFTFRTDLWATWEELVKDIFSQANPLEHLERCIELGYITPIK